DKKQILIQNEEEKVANPAFWNDPKEAEAVMNNLRSLRKWVQDYNTIATHIEELEILFDFYKEGEASEAEITQLHKKLTLLLEEVEFRNMLSDEGDSLSAVLQITACAGVSERCDWASMFLRMYLVYADKSDFKVKELVIQEGDVA